MSAAAAPEVSAAERPEPSGQPAPRRRATARDLWPLWALLAAAGAVRLATLGMQSFWYDEAFTPVHVLAHGLGATLRAIPHTENTPPLWYVLAWGWSRLFGTGAVSLRLPSALVGVATVGVGWSIGRELAGRRAAIVLTAILAVNPLLVWYSQEARAYALFALLGSLSVALFLRVRARNQRRDLLLWVLVSALALLTHYFAVFLIAPEAIYLLAEGRSRRARLIGVGAVAAVGLALVPLIVAQGGHGTQWIGRWALSSRLQAIPQYYLLGTSGQPLGRGLLVLAALPVLAALALLGRLTPSERRGATVALVMGATGILAPLVLALGGADYLAPRNLIVAWIPLSAALAVVLGARRAGRAGVLLAVGVCVVSIGVLIAVDSSARLQRGDWRGVARMLPGAATPRAVVTVGLGSAPLEYYLPGLRRLAPGAGVPVSEVDLVGYAPLVAGARRPPAPGFALTDRRSVRGLVVLRFEAAQPVLITERALVARRITRVRSEVLVGGPAAHAG